MELKRNTQTPDGEQVVAISCNISVYGVHYLSKAVTEIVTTTKLTPEEAYLSGVETNDRPRGHSGLGCFADNDGGQI